MKNFASDLRFSQNINGSKYEGFSKTFLYAKSRGGGKTGGRICAEERIRELSMSCVTTRFPFCFAALLGTPIESVSCWIFELYKVLNRSAIQARSRSLFHNVVFADDFPGACQKFFTSDRPWEIGFAMRIFKKFLKAQRSSLSDGRPGG